jgi:hypothetical protein
MQERFDSLCRRLEEGFSTIPEEEGIAAIDAAIAEDRAARRNNSIKR